MKKVLKWTGIVLGGLVLLLAGFYCFIYFNIESRINKVYAVQPKPVKIRTDSASMAKGKHISEIRGCTGCHNPDFGGGFVFADETTPIGILSSNNITSGKGGINYTDQDWIKALRHGIGKDNKPLWFMPSHEIYMLSNQDLGALIGYVKAAG